MHLMKWLTATVSGLMLVSCVTINIYFPAAAAEKAADRIIEDVWGPETQPADTAEPDKQDKQSSTSDSRLPLAMSVLNWMVPQAEAAGADININSPAINALQSNMKTRHESLKPFYNSGAIGLTDDGFITLRDAKSVPLKDRNQLNSLIAAENNDRKALYAEIARANGHPEWQDDIQQTFAQRWISNAAKGWWYQQGGSWKQK
ncbi:YdbL family protein [Methylophaga thalassica]|uniref:YdbL family protein n=1 Tax=Methylophaga thalassica TaxID=40223 RepID=UPI002E7C028D|nr:YdbL family protein [Methylophaga thalassica]WVI86349.1 YdbL family protein [Methylophaga thalassica]